MVRCRWDRVRVFAAALTALAWLTALPASADAIDRYVEAQRRIYALPAVIVGVMRDGKLVDARAWGEVDVELKVKASTRHVFEIGSISKQFTAYAILMLADEGRVDLDAPVSRYVDGLPDAWGRASLHALLTHTSGLPDLEAAFGYGVYRETPGDEAFLAKLAPLKVEFEPGARWHYSNTNYWLLAKVVERASGTTYAAFMQRRVFEPLGMTSTRSALPATLLPGRASGYEWTKGVLENRDPMQPHTARGLGDLTTTVADMARWEQEQRSPRLVSLARVRKARQGVVLNDGTEVPYGYGWSTEALLPRPTLSHDGQSAGFTASYVRVPDLGLAVVVLCNSFNGPTERMARYVARHAHAALRLPKPRPIADPAPSLTRRLADVLASGAAAPTAWREEWFAPQLWSQLNPWLPQVAESHAALGPVKQLTPVGDGQSVEGRTLRYRVVYAGLTRLRTVTFDAQGRIAKWDSEDE